VSVVIFCAVLGALFAVAVRNDELACKLNREAAALEEAWYEEYFKRWMDSDEIDLLSPEAWQHERDAPKLPPAEVKPTAPYR